MYEYKMKSILKRIRQKSRRLGLGETNRQLKEPLNLETKPELENPNLVEATNQHVHVSLIESLPAELKLQVLTLLKPQDVRSIVHASPIFYQLYAQNRRRV
jgi:hypothetical protein